MKAELVRFIRNERTFGALHIGKHNFITLERPWKDNTPWISCIPAGHYKCLQVNSPKFGDTWEVTAVPGRSAILFHTGNWVSNSSGCILLGTRILDSGAGIGNSKRAFDQFMAVTQGYAVIDLEIQDGAI